MIEKKKVLFLSPHADDVEMACGIAILKHLESGDRVKIIAFANRRETSHHTVSDMLKEYYDSMNVLGVKEFEHLDFRTRELEQNISKITDWVYKILKSFKPDIMYIPSLSSRHEDHLTVAKAGVRAAGRLNINVLGYHIIGDSTTFSPTYFEVATELQANKRMEALRCYKSQYIDRVLFTDNNFNASLIYYASMTDNGLVEPYEVIKWIEM